MPEYTAEEMIDMLATPELLTERQATAFVQRRIEATPGYAVAEDMDISEATLSGHVADAEAKIQSARETLDALHAACYQTREQRDLSPSRVRSGLVYQTDDGVWEVVDRRSKDEGEVPEPTAKVRAIQSDTAERGHAEWVAVDTVCGSCERALSES